MLHAGRRRLGPAVEQRHHVGLRGEVAEEHLLPEAIEPLKLHAQRHGGLDAVVRADRVVLGLDVPAGLDVVMQPGVFGGGNPAAALVPLPFFIAAEMGLRQPAELLAPDEARPQFLHLVERAPLVAELLIAEQPPHRLVIGIGLHGRHGQIEGQSRVAASHGVASHVEERRGVLAPQPPEPRIPLHDFFRQGRPAVWPDRPRRATPARRACTDRWDRAHGGSAGPAGQPVGLTPLGQFRDAGGILRPQLRGRPVRIGRGSTGCHDSTHPTNRAVAIPMVRSGGLVRYAHENRGSKGCPCLKCTTDGREVKRSRGAVPALHSTVTVEAG